MRLKSSSSGSIFGKSICVDVEISEIPFMYDKLVKGSYSSKHDLAGLKADCLAILKQIDKVEKHNKGLK